MSWRCTCDHYRWCQCVGKGRPAYQERDVRQVFGGRLEWPPGVNIDVVSAYPSTVRLLPAATERTRVDVIVYERIGKFAIGGWEVRYGDQLIREGNWYETRHGRVYFTRDHSDCTVARGTVPTEILEVLP